MRLSKLILEARIHADNVLLITVKDGPLILYCSSIYTRTAQDK